MKRLRSFSIKDLPVKPLAWALGFGLPGGLVFQACGLPMPWLLGPMTFTLAATLWFESRKGPRLGVPEPLRKLALFLIGGVIGGSFASGTLDRAGDWPWTLAAMLVFVVVCAVVMTAWLHYGARFPMGTALYSSLPGGLATIMALAQEKGGDVRRVAAVHGIRIIAVVFVLPVVVSTGLGLDTVPSAAVEAAPVLWMDVLEFVAIGLAGFGLAKLVRFPAPYMTGPIMAGAIAHLAGWSDARLPAEAQVACFLIMGSAIGCRFAGTSLRELAAIAKAALVGVLVLLPMAAVWSWVVAEVLGLDPVAVLLAFAPGGVFEMCLIALALGIDPAFVAFHHLVRLVFLLIAAPLVLPRVAALLERRPPVGED
ncbi:MAG: AbrB family transcriptional regulator [Rhodospirillales bacterium]